MTTTNCKLLRHLVFALAYTLFSPQGFSQSSTVPFSFSLPGAARTSAGVFKKDGTLIKTLWGGVSYGSGSHSASWDGTDDNGELVSDSSYDIRVLSNNVVYTWEGVIGNTSGASSGSTVMHAFQTINSIAISGTTGYYATNYNETGTATFKFNTASPQSKTSIMDKGGTINLVTTDGNYVYWAGEDPYNLVTTFVYATRTSDDQQVTFSNGSPVTLTYISAPMISCIDVGNNTNSKITGLAVQKAGNYLFVAHQLTNQIDVLNKTTGALVRVLPITAPNALAMDAADNLWISSGTTISKFNINADGSLMQASITLNGFSSPLAIAVSPDNNTVVIADGGSNQQLLAYNNNSGVALWTYGQTGGYATDATVTNDKFYFSDLDGVNRSFLCFAPDGTFWVGDPGNNRSLHLNADRTFINRIMYMPHFYGCSVDPNNPTRAFADYLEFKIDYSKSLDPNNGSWTLIKNWGYNITPAYSDQGRLHLVTTLSNGRTYALVRHANAYAIAELPGAGGLRFTGIETPDLTFQLYPDGSLRSGLFITSLGVPSNYISKTLLGFDASNNPMWDAGNILASSPPATGTDPLSYGSGNTAMTSSNIVVSFDAGLPPFGSSGFHLGGIRLGDKKWLWRTAPSTFKDYSGPFPSDGSYDIGNRVQYAGSVALALDRNIIWGYHGEFWKNSQTNKWNHVYDDGLFVGQFGITGPETNGTEAAAMMAGNALTAALVKDANGNAYLYHTDEFTHSGFHRWKITGLNTIQEQTVPVVLNTNLSHGLLGVYMDGSDLNNCNSKTSRVDTAVNFNWGSSIPGGTQIANANNFSVRWSGYVKPNFSDSYIFYVNTDERLRLWVNDSLIIDQWNNNGTASFSSIPFYLTGGNRYSIRLEYGNASSNGTSTVSLSWSSPSQPKQVIPSANLFAAPPSDISNGIDLMEGLHFYRTLENNVYGWSRNPVNEDNTNLYGQWWSVQSGVKTTYSESGSPDVYANYSQNSGVYTVTRDLGSPPATVNSWKLSGAINYEDNNANTGNTGGMYFEVLDAAGKVLTRLQTILAYNNGNPEISIVANNTTIINAGAGIIQPVIFQVQPIAITLSNGKATISYGPYPPVVVPILDGTGNWQSPKTMRLYFWDNGANYSRVIDLVNMRFSYNGNVPPVPPVNKRPVAHAGPDITITLPLDSVNLDGSASLDSDGTITTYAWRNISGPASFSIANSGASSTIVNSLVQGIYAFQLVVTDNSGDSSADTLSVTVNAALPTDSIPPIVAPPDTIPPVITPPDTIPPVITPPDTIPPVIVPPDTIPPVITPPDTIPPVVIPPDTIPPVITPPDTIPPVIVPPDTIPPVIVPPDTIPPVIVPPDTIPPVIVPPDTIPPVVVPPDTIPPVIVPPDTIPPVVVPPDTIPPVIAPPDTIPPVIVPPDTLPPVIVPPDTIPPVIVPPDTIPPVVVPPVIAPPDTIPPVIVPPDTIPPVIIPPDTIPPVVIPPDTIPPVIVPPDTIPPVVVPPDTIPPVIVPPGTIPPVVVPPDTIPPVIVPPGTIPPVIVPPGVTPPVVIPPTGQNPRGNLPPVANAGVHDTTLIYPSNSIHLIGSGSYDPDGRIVSYSWRQIDSQEPAVIWQPDSADAYAIQLKPGEYQFELTVTDNDGAVARDSVKIIEAYKNNVSVKTINIYPNPVPEYSITVTASNTLLGNGNIMIYDISGRQIRQIQFEKTEENMKLEIKLPPMAKGPYVMVVSFSDQVPHFFKIIKM